MFYAGFMSKTLQL